MTLRVLDEKEVAGAVQFSGKLRKPGAAGILLTENGETIEGALGDRALSSDVEAALGGVNSALSERPTATEIADPSFAVNIGTTTGNVQADLDGKAPALYEQTGTAPSEQDLHSRLQRLIDAADYGVGSGGNDATRLTNAANRANELGVPLLVTASTISLSSNWTAPAGTKMQVARGVTFSGAGRIKGVAAQYEHMRDGTLGADYTKSAPRVGRLWSKGDQFGIDKWQQNWSVSPTYWQFSDYENAFYHEFEQNSTAAPNGWPQATLVSMAVSMPGNLDFPAAFHAIAWCASEGGSVWGINTIVGNCQNPWTPLATNVRFICGHEIDFQPANGTNLTSGAGELINSFWTPADCAALAIAKDAGGGWKEGVYIQGIQTTGTGVNFATGVSMACGIDMSFASFTSAAMAIAADDPILFKKSGGDLGFSLHSDGLGNAMIENKGSSLHIIAKDVTEGTEVMSIDTPSYAQSVVMKNANGNYANSAAATIVVRANSTTTRSINAGGTINASGADYAEYEWKRDDCGPIAKGQIIGFDADGLVTDRWEHAISFGVKSTDPNLVGGDRWWSDLGERPLKPEFTQVTKWDGSTRPVGGKNNPEKPWEGGERPKAKSKARDKWDAQRREYEDAWHKRLGERQADWDAKRAVYDAAVAAEIAAYETGPLAEWLAAVEAYDARHEAIREHVDRIAYCGKVPVNVTGATAGQFIVAVQEGDGIGGVAKSYADMTREEFDLLRVGGVRRILEDGRAEIVPRMPR